MIRSGLITPRRLVDGDTIAILAPAGRFDTSLLQPACDTLAAYGYRVKVMPHATGVYGTYSGTVEQRLLDFADAYLNPEVRAIICARGGYGAVHLLDKIVQMPLSDDPKWLVGFSDISALHAVMNVAGVQSIHASMLRGLARGISDRDNMMLDMILRGGQPHYEFDPHPFNISGECRGVMVGGNLSVLTGLMGTPYNLFSDDCILFIEDINEPMYKVDRMLHQLRLAGVLSKLRGLIVGRFAGTHADANRETVESLIHDMVADYDYPVAMGVPVGHEGRNVPLVEGATVTLRVDDVSVTLDTALF